MQVEVAQFRADVACGAVLIRNHRDLHRRYAVACAMPAAQMQRMAVLVRTRLQQTAKELIAALSGPAAPAPMTF